jgi:sugar (pentulose or hexulose) kinase
MNLEWFRRELGGPAATFDELDALAGAVAPSDTLPLFVPHLGGRVSPGWPALRGAWAGLTWDHTRAEMFRAVLEGVALEYALYQEALRRLLPAAAFGELRVTGGGGKSAVWNQIKADALQMPLVQIENSGGAARRGDARGRWRGIFPDPHAAAERGCGWVSFLPRPLTGGVLPETRRALRAVAPPLNNWSTLHSFRHEAYAPATRPTMFFIGVTTGKSSINKVFPRWAERLGLGECELRGMDFPPRRTGALS